MRCQSCGKEIADKAIVCYRCGTPTAIPVPSPVGRADQQHHRTSVRWGRWLVWLLVAVAASAVAWALIRS